ncbi:MAG: large conductance mechanosensitive channel protein MscL [Pontixanthobacter sp.]
MLNEFKEFIAKGNVMELAVAVIIAGAFAVIVSSMTDDIIMPLVGMVFGDVDFSAQYIVLSGEVEEGMSLVAAREAGANVLAYGAFITAILNFLILSFIIFLLVRYVNKVKARLEGPAEPDAPAEPTEVELLKEIRDSLKRQEKP